MTAGQAVMGAAPAALRPDDSFRQAARVAMWPQVQRLLDLEPALRDVEATDDLKRYRVATRRLRAALRVFDDALPKRARRAVEAELRELARAVGRVRDLDVRLAGLPDGDNLMPLRDAWTTERAAGAAEVAQRLGTKRHARLVDGLARLAGSDDAGSEDAETENAGTESAAGRRTVRDRAGSAVWAAFERLRAATTNLDARDLDALHDVRIRAKRLRYTIEFLAPVLGADREWLIGRLVELQDHLGALNDAHIAGGAARAFLGEGLGLTEGQRAAIEAYVASHDADVERLRAAAPGVAATVASPIFARRLSRSILGPA